MLAAVMFWVSSVGAVVISILWLDRQAQQLQVSAFQLQPAATTAPVAASSVIMLRMGQKNSDNDFKIEQQQQHKISPSTASSSGLLSRRQGLSAILAGGVTATAAMALGGSPSTARAAAEEVDREKLKVAFARVRQELESEKGGVAYMQNCIDRRDFEALLEFTKEYDGQIRKAGMVGVKKMLTDKEQMKLITPLSNAVTFDLIGINRSSRPGAAATADEAAEGANKYLQELRQDVQKFLDLEKQVGM